MPPFEKTEGASRVRAQRGLSPRVATSLKRGFPLLVSLAILAWLVGQVDLQQLLSVLSPRLAGLMVAALLVYGAATLLLEALSLRMLIPGDVPGFGAWTAARIKCASYLLSILHYALGMGALAVLLRRRTPLSLAEAGSMVLLISVVDLVVVVSIIAIGSAFLQGIAPALPLPAVAAILLGFPTGLWLLRTPRSLGPLEALRSLRIFAALREASLLKLAQLFGLRVLFVGCFATLCSVTFPRFGVQAPLADVVVGTLVVGFVAGLPIAVAGLGTSQAAFLFLFRDYASQEALLAQSLVLSAGILALRGGMGVGFASEFTREALAASREEPA